MANPNILQGGQDHRLVDILLQKFAQFRLENRDKSVKFEGTGHEESIVAPTPFFTGAILILK